ncbi:hypothetical protein DTL42_13125 [Bremerella cremea]|uniref:Uncharacterized protein n=1 Tax=Bremerella cremea TaxID=1031537 RepID=A0A368KRN0_9BACT|nr:hypothetical protein DTL42_13125 [Bremerella cremea]
MILADKRNRKIFVEFRRNEIGKWNRGKRNTQDNAIAYELLRQLDQANSTLPIRHKVSFCRISSDVPKSLGSLSTLRIYGINTIETTL